VTNHRVAELKSVDWIQHGGDWVRILEEHLRQIATVRGTRIRRGGQSRDTWARIEYEFNPAATGGVLKFVVHAKPLNTLLLVVEVSDGFDSMSIERWRRLGDAMRHALPNDLMAFTWEALLGIENQLNAYREPGTIGPLLALPSYALAQTDASLPFAPIRLVGTLRGVSWRDSKQTARRDARLAAAVLSVVWDRLVRIFHEVWCEDAGERPGILEEMTPFAGLISAGEVPHVDHWQVPDWLDNGVWTGASTDVNLSNALLVFHEALSLERNNHHSFAFSAYCAALEALGARLVDLDPKCDCCGAQTGAFRRFKAAIAIVQLSPDREKRLKRMYGDYRSETVHGALLHGGEDGGQAQSQIGNPFLIEDATRFHLGLALIRWHTRNVLERVLRTVSHEQT